MGWDAAIEARGPYRCQWFREGKIPGVICEICGRTWSRVSGRRLARPLPDDPELKQWLRPKPVPVSDYSKICVHLRRALKLSDDYRLFPGLDIGLGTVNLSYADLLDFIWPTPWTILLSPRAAKAMETSGLEGFEIAPVGFLEVEAREQVVPIKELFELIVTGEGGTAAADSGISVVERCYRCGFVEYSPFSDGLRVDPAQWDGSDFFLLEEYPTYVLASDRARRFLEESGLTNVAFLDARTLPFVGPVKKV